MAEYAGICKGLERLKSLTESEGCDEVRRMVAPSELDVDGSTLPSEPATLDAYLADRLDLNGKALSSHDGHNARPAELHQGPECQQGPQALLSPAPTESSPAASETVQFDHAGVSLMELAALIRSLSPGPQKQMLYGQLHDMISEDGRTLFEHHATAYLTGVIARSGHPMARGPTDAAVWADILWTEISVLEIAFWQWNTAPMRSALSRHVEEGLHHLKTDGSTRRSRRYARRVGQAIDALSASAGSISGTLHKGRSIETRPSQRHESSTTMTGCDSTPSVELPEHSSTPKASTSVLATGIGTGTSSKPVPTSKDEPYSTEQTARPVIEFLYGSSAIDVRPEAVVDKILMSLASLQSSNPGMRLRIRHGGMRVNYDIGTNDVTSITSRLNAVIDRNPTIKKGPKKCTDVLDRIEWLLRPFVGMNRDHPALVSLRQVALPKDKSLKHKLPYSSCISWMHKQQGEVVVMAAERKDEIVKVIMEGLRERVGKNASPKQTPGKWCRAWLTGLGPTSSPVVSRC
jgi:hypothetical protein